MRFVVTVSPMALPHKRPARPSNNPWNENIRRFTGLLPCEAIVMLLKLSPSDHIKSSLNPFGSAFGEFLWIAKSATSRSIGLPLTVLLIFQERKKKYTKHAALFS
jgi:hypothetical protein